MRQPVSALAAYCCRRFLLPIVVIGAVVGCGNEKDTNPQTTGLKDAGVSLGEATDLGNALSFEPEEGFQLLALEDFEAFQTEDGTWSEDGTTITCSGKPRGYLYTRRDYSDFTLRLDYRFTRPDDLQDDASFAGNTGFLIHTADSHKLWPISLEVQGKYPEMATIKANGGAADIEINDNPEARDQARRPVGEWNSIEILSKQGALTAFINGTKVCESLPGELTQGRIGIQSEDFEFQVRNVRIRED